jgi:hypothetical protein
MKKEPQKVSKEHKAGEGLKSPMGHKEGAKMSHKGKK